MHIDMDEIQIDVDIAASGAVRQIQVMDTSDGEVGGLWVRYTTQVTFAEGTMNRPAAEVDEIWEWVCDHILDIEVVDIDAWTDEMIYTPRMDWAEMPADYDGELGIDEKSFLTIWGVG